LWLWVNLVSALVWLRGQEESLPPTGSSPLALSVAACLLGLMVFFNMPRESLSAIFSCKSSLFFFTYRPVMIEEEIVASLA